MSIAEAIVGDVYRPNGTGYMTAVWQPIPGALIHHSDRGVQYACTEYTEILAAYDIQPSMTRLGNPYDNARPKAS